MAHDPLQLDLVGVSGANEYSVKPLALVITMTPLIVVVFRAELEAAAGEEAALDELAAALGVLLPPPSMRTRTPQRSGRLQPGQPGQTIDYA